jgi:RNA polymerase sigma factor (sigma-70 family)
MNAPLLQKHEELVLAKAWKEQGSQAARARLLQAYQPLVRSIATRYMRPGLDRDDLIQEGNIGFLAGLDNFDPSMGHSVGTLARFHVAARMQIHVGEFAGVLRLPNSRRIKKMLTQCFAALKAAEAQKGRELTNAEKEAVATELGFSLAEIQEYERAMRPPKSLSHAAGTEDEPGFEIADENTLEDVQVKARSLAGVAGVLRDILASMPERTRTILILRHMNPEFVSLESIAEDLNLSRERVRRIEIEALLELRQKLEDAGIANLGDVL